MVNSKEILEKIKKAAQEIEPTVKIILFGSRARGDENINSDWDILILTPYPADLKIEQTFRHKFFDIELAYGQAISTFVYSKPEWDNKYQITPLYQNIQEEGITI